MAFIRVDCSIYKCWQSQSTFSFHILFGSKTPTCSLQSHPANRKQIWALFTCTDWKVSLERFKQSDWHQDSFFSEMFRDEKWNFDWTRNKPCNKHKLAFYPTLRGRERASETNVCRIPVDVKEAKRRIDRKLPNQKRFTILYGSFDLRTNGINEDQITISFHLTFATSNARYLSFYSMLKRESCASFVFSTQPELSTFNGARYINCYHCH